MTFEFTATLNCLLFISYENAKRALESKYFDIDKKRQSKRNSCSEDNYETESPNKAKLRGKEVMFQLALTKSVSLKKYTQ